LPNPRCNKNLRMSSAALLSRILRVSHIFLTGLLVFVTISMSACGYHVAGRAANLPSEWKTIAVPAFKNDTTHYRIEQRFTAAVIRQILQRTKYKVIQDEASADAVLHGEVLSIESAAVLFDATTGQVTTTLLTVHTKVLLIDNQTKKIVYENDDMLFRDEYQISSDVQSFFEEQDPALDRMARDFAAQLVSNVTEKF
jgi:outer membrane lipopolysaccharide assembly protein LptE/RlpB